MNFIFIVGLVWPLAISGHSLLEMNSIDFGVHKVAHQIGLNASAAMKKPADLTSDFITEMKECLTKIGGASNPEYQQCLKEQAKKLKDVKPDPNDPKLQCCIRVMNYECMKYFLTMFCEVPKEEVDQNLDVLFNYLNNVNVPGYPNHCSGSRQESFNYCFSTDANPSTTKSITTPKTTDSSDSSLALACNIPLQLTVLFVLYLFCFKL